MRVVRLNVHVSDIVILHFLLTHDNNHPADSRSNGGAFLSDSHLRHFCRTENLWGQKINSVVAVSLLSIESQYTIGEYSPRDLWNVWTVDLRG